MKGKAISCAHKILLHLPPPTPIPTPRLFLQADNHPEIRVVENVCFTFTRLEKKLQRDRKWFGCQDVSDHNKTNICVDLIDAFVSEREPVPAARFQDLEDTLARDVLFELISHFSVGGLRLARLPLTASSPIAQLTRFTGPELNLLKDGCSMQREDAGDYQEFRNGDVTVRHGSISANRTRTITPNYLQVNCTSNISPPAARVPLQVWELLFRRGGGLVAAT
ncbi:unnamed protein product [Pleuronectes platessa]|uniref:Uncharacterized protein n=1 Tax=Pleuronectes platessa TaxID=8262 RepID=A0A9N7YIV5_PLEPL|nr:unnamed protein product [Pleuronectes platessa]